VTAVDGLEEQLAESLTKIENLEIALKSARRIGAAIGIVMANRKLTEDQAFDVLVRVSQDTHRKLRDLADEVVLTGIIPDSSMPTAS